MKKLVFTIMLASLLYACQQPDNAKSDASSTAENATTTSYLAIDSDDALVATALMAAPKEKRRDATVIGYNMAGEFVTLKEGSNEFICLADDPNQDGFNAAAYHKELEPFMARGRALKTEGKTPQEIFDIREEEIKSGKLQMGSAGTTLHIYYGPNATYDPETSEVAEAMYRYVVYMPFATGETTGLPEKPKLRNHPWLMDAGTHKAHIMISPKH